MRASSLAVALELQYSRTPFKGVPQDGLFVVVREGDPALDQVGAGRAGLPDAEFGVRVASCGCGFKAGEYGKLHADHVHVSYSKTPGKPSGSVLGFTIVKLSNVPKVSQL